MARREPSSGAASGGVTYRSNQPFAWAIMLLRIFVGAKFIETGVDKWSWLGTDHLHMVLQKCTTGPTPSAYPSYLPFLNTYVMPHIQGCTYLLVFGELIVGGMLVLGLATRLAALPALLLSMNFMFATWNAGYEWQTVNEAFIAIEIALLLSGAGRFGGLDAPLSRKHPRWPIW